MLEKGFRDGEGKRVREGKAVGGRMWRRPNRI